MADLTPEQQATLAEWEAILASDKGPEEHDTYVGDPTDAHSFYQFVYGRPVRMSCPPGMIFNPTIRPGPVCDHPLNVSLNENPAPRKDWS